MKDEQECVVLISLYVDDLIIAGDVTYLIDEIKQKMSQVFEMKHLGELKYYLGFEIWRDSAKSVLRYLQSTVDYGIIYTDSSDVRLAEYADSDWAGNVDDHIFITGYAFILGSGVITSSSKKQNTVSLSSAEAEYQAMCAATCEAVCLQILLQDVGEE
eukprot:PITA_27176